MHNLVSQKAVITGAGWPVVKQDQVLISGLVMTSLYFRNIKEFIKGGKEEVAIIIDSLFK